MRLPRNFLLWGEPYPDIVVGTVIIVGDDGSEDLADVPIGLEEWEQMLREWGN